MSEFNQAEYDEAITLYDEAVYKAEIGNIDDAIDLAIRSSKIELHQGTAFRLSLWYSIKENRDEALKWAGLAFALNPRHSQIGLRFAEECNHRGNTDRAKEVLESVLRINQDFGPAKKLLAQLRDTHGSSDEVSS